MSRTSPRTDGEVVREFLSVADLLAEPRLARIYAQLAREGPATVADLMDDLELAQGTAYDYVNRLEEAGVVEATTEEQPRSFVARDLDLTISAADGEYTIGSALVDAVARSGVDEDLATFVDRHGVAGLAAALPRAVARERGETTHRQVAEDLDISPLSAEIVLQALRPVVREHYVVPDAGASLSAVEAAEGDAQGDVATDDA